LKNTIVLVVPSDSKLGITNFTDLIYSDVNQIAIGDPASVPAGKYGVSALNFYGIYNQVKSKLILCADVRTVLTYVESDEVDAGIVYSTDALTSKAVKVVAQGPDSVNAKIVYPVAVISGSKVLDAATKYEAFLSSNQSKAIFEKYGFVLVEK
jgi:molybdate transport system substrate-binding protein